ncbi:hypothetical protein C8Q77DRAFT_1045243 [Trametes polyzona]|nr:hypothetical protein C8Q77DRAFT_1045243 [Trametes polyzona]
MSITTRPSLPTSSSDFALPSSPSASLPPSSSDDLSPFMLRLRRPSLLGPRAGGTAPHAVHSPLVTSFTRRYSSNGTGDDSESDRDKMSTDSDSGNATPLLPGPPIDSESDTSMKTSRPRTPPRLTSASSSSSGTDEQMSGMRVPHQRKLSKSAKMPHIQRLVAESHTQENEVKSEAQFQRMLASFSMHPRTPRPASDRGRYPEDAAEEEPQRESTPSDDEELDETIPFAYTDSAGATKPVTPAHSINGDDLSMLDSPIGFAMDVDTPSSAVGSPSISSWRYTPPPTSTSAVRNKRKLDDRYDPYPTAAKRRAVSPSVNHLRMGNGAPRLSMPIPIPIPNGIHSGASSPVVQGSSSYFNARQSFGSASAMSSPTLRAQIGLSSPVLRPMTRARRDGEREVDGAEEGVNGLSIA